MANTVNILGFANTFGDWIVATNADSNEINSIGKYDWTKDSGTLILNGTGTGLSVGNNAIIAGQLQVTGTDSSATIDNNLTVGKQVYFTNTSQSLTASGTVIANGTVYASNTGTGLAVANNTTIGGSLTVGGATRISNTATITGAANVANSLIVSGPTTLGNTLSVGSVTYTSYLTTNNRTTTAQLTSTGAADFGTTIDVGTSVTIAGINVIPYITTVYTHANSSYAAQNTTGSYANSAFLRANSAYAAQNTTGVYANSAFAAQNTTGVYANSAFGIANAAAQYANSAYLQANSAFAAQNTTGSYANSAYLQANSAYAAQNTTGTYANSAYLQANSAYAAQNTTGVYANAAFIFANNLQSGAQTFNTMTLTGASLSATNAVGAFQSLTTTGGLSVGGSFTINGTTIYTSNNFVINANTFTPVTSYFSVNRGTANNQPNGIPNANASIRWSETSKYFEILDVNNGTQYSQIMTANMISDSTTSTSTTTVPTNKNLSGAFTQANSSYVQANSSYSAQNTTGVYANAAYLQANSAFGIANGAAQYANAAYVQANSAYAAQNTTGTYANAAYVQANSSYSAQNTTGVYANSAFSTANSAGLYANSAFLRANNALANTGTSVVANSLTVYTFSNTSFSSSNTTGAVTIIGGLGVRGNVYTGNVVITGSGNGITFVDGTIQTTAGSPGAAQYANSAYGAANSAGVYANAAYVQANSSYSAQNTTGVYANSAFGIANGAAQYANAAYVQANAAFTAANNSVDTWVRLQANTAYSTANSAGLYANSAFVRANNSLNVQTGGTITGDLGVTGNLFVNGSTSYINVATFQTVDSLIELASNNLTDTIDIGFYGQYVSSGTKYAGLVRSAGANWTLFQSVATKPSSNTVGTITYGNYATLKANIDAGQITSSVPIGPASGGSGLSSPTANSILIANGSNVMKLVAPGLAGNVVVSDGVNWYSGAASPTVSFTNDVATTSQLFPLFSDATTGSASTIYTANSRLLYKPSTGEFSSNTFIATNGMIQNSNTVSANATIIAGNNGLSAGPVTVPSGVIVTISSGAVWTIV